MNIFIIGVDFKYERRNTFVVSDRQARKRKKTRQAILEASRVLLLERGLTMLEIIAEELTVQLRETVASASGWSSPPKFRPRTRTV